MRSTNMRWAAAAALALLLAACAAPSKHAKEQPGSVQEQVEANWLVPSGAQCHRKVLARVQLAPDGTVQGVDLMKPTAPDERECRRVEDSVRRAVALSSPLKFPAGETPQSVLWLGFDPETWAAQ